jgi:cyanate permease
MMVMGGSVARVANATAAAGGIAVINSIGNISGYAAPQLVGILRDTTGSYETPMLVLGVLVLQAGVLVPVAARTAESQRQWQLATVTE